ncbi:MAG: bifunctional aspartate kinase/homoserine dehydrogenase I, partial [Prevotellaceae bacterium]|nr:bifunctional aspartate kinase/homoserine dehydrogenase I [Prevotellaceae bacterium]
MKVLKFGGTSVGSVQGIRNLKKIVEAEKVPVVVVVSALSGITDQLYKTANLAVAADESYRAEYEQMYRRHLEIIDTVIPEGKKEAVVQQVEVQFQDLSNILRGIYLIKDMSTKIIDTIVSYG